MGIFEEICKWCYKEDVLIVEYFGMVEIQALIVIVYNTT